MRFPWTPFERRWRDELVALALPVHDAVPGAPPVDLAAFWPALDEAAPPVLRHGFRAAVWVLTWWPLLHGRPRRLGRLPGDDADRLLAAVATSRWYPIRQLAEVVRMVTCLAVLRDPGVRRTIDPAAGP